MDFNALNTVKIANTGAWMHLKSPLDGNELYFGEVDKKTGEMIYDLERPCRIKVLGIEGNVAQKMAKRAQKSLMKATQDPDEDGQESIRQKAIELTVDFENVMRDDAPAKAPDDLEWFFGLSMVIGKADIPKSFQEQVLAFSTDRMAEVGNVKGG